MTRLLTKMFEEHRVAHKPPGAAPGSWVVKDRTAPVDEAINCWLRETGHRLVSCSPPGFHVQWLDKEMTIRAVIIAVMVTYEEGPRERTHSAADPADRPPEPAEAAAEAGAPDPEPAG